MMARAVQSSLIEPVGRLMTSISASFSMRSIAELTLSDVMYLIDTSQASASMVMGSGRGTQNSSGSPLRRLSLITSVQCRFTLRGRSLLRRNAHFVERGYGQSHITMLNIKPNDRPDDLRAPKPFVWPPSARITDKLSAFTLVGERTPVRARVSTLGRHWRQAEPDIILFEISLPDLKTKA